MPTNNSYIAPIDPMAALVGFVNDVKPYHSKIVSTEVQYTKTDNAALNPTESLSFQWSLPILNVLPTNNEIIVAYDQSLNLVPNTPITISGSQGDDGTYTIASVVFASPITNVTVTQTLAVNGAVGGSIIYTRQIV